MSRAEWLLPKLPASLTTYDKFERKPAAQFNGPKAYRPTTHGNRGVFLADELVLEIRRMRDWHGKSIAQIAAATGLRECTVGVVCRYINRVHLDPGPRPAP